MNDDDASAVVIVGAGPAGLATARELGERGVPYRLLERGQRTGQSWADAYDSLRLHTGRHLSHLPGLAFPRGTPLFPTRDVFVRYLDLYVERFRIRVETGTHVLAVTRARSDGRPASADAAGARWAIHTDRGDTGRGALSARHVVLATGIMANPVLPHLPGMDTFEGEVMHSVAYRRPAPFHDRRVLVVGAGNSGAEIASELAAAGAGVTIAVRSGVNVVPRTLLGLPIQYHSALVRKLPRAVQERVVAGVRRITIARRGPPVLPVPAHSPLDAIPVIGFHLVDAIRAGRVVVRPGVERFTRSGVRYTDGAAEPFDTVILATGFRAATGPLGPLIRTDARGFALRSDRVSSADHAGLFFVGHNYDSTGGLANIRRDARLAARLIAS